VFFVQFFSTDLHRLQVEPKVNCDDGYLVVVGRVLLSLRRQVEKERKKIEEFGKSL